MLDGAASQELARPDGSLASWAADDTPEQFSVTIEYNGQGAVAVVVPKPGLEAYDKTLQEMALDLRIAGAMPRPPFLKVPLLAADCGARL